jgi:hypothetical protein
MSIGGILIILGCVVAGYWIVSSIMGSGIDVIEEGRKAEGLQRKPASPQGKAPAPEPQARLPARHEGPIRDWHIVLDVSADATRAEIQSAMKRRLAQAEAVGDGLSIARIKQAAEAGLSQRR